MTIIAYREGFMSADTMAQAGGLCSFSNDKLLRMQRNNLVNLYGGVGSKQKVEKFYDFIVGQGVYPTGRDLWFDLEKNAPDLIPRKIPDNDYTDYSALCVFSRVDDWENAQVFYLGANYINPVTSKYFAMGAGSDIATGAFYMGASSEEAVKAAIESSVDCGGEITAISVFE